MKKIIASIIVLAFILGAPFSVLAETNTDLFKDDTQTFVEQTLTDNKLLAESQSTTPATPYGWLDFVTTSSIGGWAWRSDIPNTPIDVHIYIRDSSGQTVSFITLTANQHRMDLAAAGYGDGYHAFSTPINWVDYAPGTYYITAYGIGYNGDNPQLLGCPISYTVRPCDGSVDYVTSSMIGGWAWKPDAPDAAIQVHIYIRRSDNSLVNLYTVTANGYREDLASGGYGNGYHAFALYLNWNTLPKEELLVEVFAVDGSQVHPKLYSEYYNNAPPHGSITLYGINFPNEGGYRNLYYTSTVQNAISNIGVTAINGPYTGTSATSALNRMQDSMIWVAHTHGNKDEVKFNHSEYGETYLTYYNMSLLPSYALENARCIIYATCRAGEGEEGAANMVNITHTKGAMTVIGWVGDTQVDQMNTWLKKFFEYSGNGATIEQAYTSALCIVSKTHGKHDLGGLDMEYIKGSTSQKLVS